MDKSTTSCDCCVVNLGIKVQKIFVIAAVFALAGCVTTQEMPLAPNVVRLDTQASGLLFAGQAAPATMRKAAQATVDRGYSYFRLDEAQTAQGSRLVGMNTYSSSDFNANSSGSTYGGTYRGSTSGNVSGSSYSTPLYAPTSSVSVTVIMFREGEPGAEGAFRAADILATKK